MKKILALFLVLIALSVPASATVSIDSINKKQLNLGDKITVSYNLSTTSDMDALFRLSLKCDSFDLDYYTIPISISRNENKSIIAPPLIVNSQMLGKCLINSILQSTDKSYSEEISSDIIDITNSIGIAIQTNSKNYFPGEKVILTGEFDQSFTPSKTLNIALERQALTLSVASSSFNSSLELRKTFKSGEHKISVTANDSYGNVGQAETTINVAQVPTSIMITVESDRLDPGEAIKANIVLLDQANDSMNGKIQTKITSQEKKDILDTIVESGSTVTKELDKFTPPGVYTIKASSLGIKSEKKITVNTINDARIEFDGSNTVTITNIGNVEYDKFTELNLLSENGKQITISQNTNLKPGEEKKIDLNKEAPTGKYTLNFASQGNPNEYLGVNIVDERPLSKKATDGLGSLTGMVVGSGEGSRSPIIIVAVLAAIVLTCIILFKANNKRKIEAKTETPIPTGIQKEPAIESTDDLDREKHRKFVEDMLKEKQFK